MQAKTGDVDAALTTYGVAKEATLVSIGEQFDQDAIIQSIIDAVMRLELKFDATALRNALENAVIQPERVVLGPCDRPVVSPLGFNL